MNPSPIAILALAIARQQIGKPYVWGASGPDSFDCSGLIWYAYQRAGYHWGRTNDVGQANAGARVSASNLIIGDLVRPHVGHIQMYAGNGRVVEAPTTGIPVREVPMWGFYDGTRISNATAPQVSGRGPGYPGWMTSINTPQNSYVNKMIQVRLSIPSDGAFGPITDSAVRGFQRSHGLADDGVVGPSTWAALWP